MDKLFSDFSELLMQNAWLGLVRILILSALIFCVGGYVTFVIGQAVGKLLKKREAELDRQSWDRAESDD